MKDKLEVGMYVRFFNGDIGKIANYEYKEEYVNGHVIYLEKDDKTGWCCEEKDFKASYNIIDLIELGDLIEVECEKDNTNVFEVVAIDYENNELGIFDNNFNIDFCSIEQIKSIVTKEQFESMSYKVEQ